MEEEGVVMRAAVWRRRMKKMAKRVCVPSWQVGVVGAAWLAMWVYILVGAAIIQAIDDSVRHTDPAVSVGQGPISYVDAVYFTETWISSCGYGDIVPVSDDSRAFLSVWSFFGNMVWVVVNGGITAILFEWILFGMVLYPWWLLRGRDNAREREKKMSNEQLFKWKVLLSSVLVGLVVWFAIHLIAAAVFQQLEPDLANYQSELFGQSFGEVLYFAIFTSQTVCLGDYTVKTTGGRLFFLAWHQPALIAAYFLFSTVALIMLKWFNARLFHMIEKVAKKASTTSSRLSWRRSTITPSP